MDDYISRQDALDALGEEPMVWTDSDGEIAERNQWRHDMNAIKASPAADVVPMETYKQTAWERDIAIEQLKELGYSLGEKVRQKDGGGRWALKRL